MAREVVGSARANFSAWPLQCAAPSSSSSELSDAAARSPKKSKNCCLRLIRRSSGRHVLSRRGASRVVPRCACTKAFNSPLSAASRLLRLSEASRLLRRPSENASATPRPELRRRSVASSASRDRRMARLSSTISSASSRASARSRARTCAFHGFVARLDGINMHARERRPHKKVFQKHSRVGPA